MSAARSTVSMSSAAERRLGELGTKIFGMAGGVGVLAIVASLLIAMLGSAERGGFLSGGWERFYRSYLMAFMLVLSICLGALFFVILQHCVKAGWSVVLRRIAEGVASNLTWIWVLFIPIAIGMFTGHLYEWADPAIVEKDHVLQDKAPYLNPTFWMIRAVLFFGVWAFLAWFFYSNSAAQDQSGDVRLTRRMEKFAPVAVGLYFITQAFASMDWVMSLEPHWFSTMFPVYFFASSCCGYFAVQVLLMFFAQSQNRLRSEITLEHYQDAGKLLFAFGIVFWAYIAYSQYMLIWYANLPEETPWYMTRQMGGWLGVSLLLLLGHFLGPFLFLISRHPKRRKPVLVGAAAWMLLVHMADIYWLVMPRVPHAVHYAASYPQLAEAVEDPQSPAALELQHLSHGRFEFSHLDIGYGWHLLDLTCLVALLALAAAGAAWRLSGVSLIPQRDPRLHESLAFENM